MTFIPNTCKPCFMNYLPAVAPVAEEEGGEDYKENGGGHLEEEEEEKMKI